MVDPGAPQISVPLYWSLPLPLNFLAELAQALDTISPFIVRLKSLEVAGVRQVVRDALQKSCHEPERIEFLDVHEGSHLESDIGHHFGRATVSAAELANWTTPPRTTIVLTPHSARARERCREYFEELVKEIASSPKPQVRLVLLWSTADDPLPPKTPTEVRFDGALSEDEMHAYVTLRMVGRRGPGSTSLVRHLVNEFAGGDALLAEELMALSPDELLELPSSLTKLAPAVSRLGRDADALHDWHLAGSSTEAATKARERLASRYWRACVRSLLPWLEERRRPVIDLLRVDLEDYLYPTKGVWKKPNPWRQGETRDIAIDDLEFNDIVAMTFNRHNPFSPSEPRSRQLIEGFRRAKAVRDELAHLRPPDTRDIRELVRTFDDVFAQSTPGPSHLGLMLLPQR